VIIILSKIASESCANIAIRIAKRKMKNKLFKFTIEVKPTDQTVLEEPISGGYIDCYAGATNIEEALKKCAYELIEKRNFSFEDVLDNASIVNLDHWDRHIKDTWEGEFKGGFPTHQGILDIQERGGVFLSPIVGYLEE